MLQYPDGLVCVCTYSCRLQILFNRSSTVDAGHTVCAATSIGLDLIVGVANSANKKIESLLAIAASILKSQVDMYQ